MSTRLTLIAQHLSETSSTTLLDEFHPTTGLRHFCLNSPKSLNAITVEMAKGLMTEVPKFHVDPNQKAILLTGTGDRAFCAGADLIEDSPPRDLKLKPFYVYTAMQFLSQLEKPVIALCHGATVGSGWGLVSSAKYIIGTETLRLAMPECRIGIIPDVGSASFLQKAKNIDGFSFALYMALTGTSLNYIDALYCGMIDHHIPQKDLPQVIKSLESESVEDYGRFLEEFSPEVDVTGSTLYQNREFIEEIFGSGGSVEEILSQLIAALEPNPTNQFLKTTKSQLDFNSPLAMKITFVVFHRARNENSSMKDILVQDWYLHRTMFYHFTENAVAGVQAILVKKSKSGRPKWKPERLEDVTTEVVQEAFDFFSREHHKISIPDIESSKFILPEV